MVDSMAVEAGKVVPTAREILKSLVALCALCASAAVFAHDHERTISQASDLVPWCQREAQARYVARNETTYQWTASYHDSGDVLIVDGKLRVHGDDVAVHCRVARGAREEYAAIEIDDAAL